MTWRLNASEIFIIFWLAVLTDIAGNIIPLPLLHYTVKPLLMPVLIAALFSHGSVTQQYRVLLLAGLLFSWAGDVLLLFEYKGALYFILGLVSFLCAHIMYIIYFLKAGKGGASLLKRKVLPTILVLGYAAALVVLLYPSLGDMRMPVMVYATTITIMMLCALYAHGQILPAKAARLFVAGAAFFLLSDSLLAINKFYKPYPFAGAFIMLTYCIAQFLIVKGTLSRR